MYSMLLLVNVSLYVCMYLLTVLLLSLSMYVACSMSLVCMNVWCIYLFIYVNKNNLIWLYVWCMSCNDMM